MLLNGALFLKKLYYTLQPNNCCDYLFDTGSQRLIAIRPTQFYA
jgi:hypothetical protein